MLRLRVTSAKMAGVSSVGVSESQGAHQRERFFDDSPHHHVCCLYLAAFVTNRRYFRPLQDAAYPPSPAHQHRVPGHPSSYVCIILGRVSML